MKLKIVFGLIALLCAVITVRAVEPVHVEFAVEKAAQLVHDYGYVAMAAPVIISANITPQLIQDMKLKYKRIKIITVTAEPAIYDLDELTSQDKANFRRLGIDIDTICNRELELKDRIIPLELLTELEKDESKANIIGGLPTLTGEVIEEAEQYQFIVRRPDRGLIKMLLPLAEKGKVDEFAEKGIKNLVVAGDMDALEDGIVYMGVVSKLRQLISPAKSFLSRA